MLSLCVVDIWQDSPTGPTQRHSFGLIPYGAPELLRSLILTCTSREPVKRPTSAAILEALLKLQHQYSVSAQVQVISIPLLAFCGWYWC